MDFSSLQEDKINKINVKEKSVFIFIGFDSLEILKFKYRTNKYLIYDILIISEHIYNRNLNI